MALIIFNDLIPALSACEEIVCRTIDKVIWYHKIYCCGSVDEYIFGFNTPLHYTMTKANLATIPLGVQDEGDIYRKRAHMHGFYIRFDAYMPLRRRLERILEDHYRQVQS